MPGPGRAYTASPRGDTLIAQTAAGEHRGIGGPRAGPGSAITRPELAAPPVAVSGPHFLFWSGAKRGAEGGLFPLPLHRASIGLGVLVTPATKGARRYTAWHGMAQHRQVNEQKKEEVKLI